MNDIRLPTKDHLFFNLYQLGKSLGRYIKWSTINNLQQ